MALGQSIPPDGGLRLTYLMNAGSVFGLLLSLALLVILTVIEIVAAIRTKYIRQ